MKDDADWWKVVFWGALIALGLWAWLTWAEKDDEDWAKYRDEHHCRVTGSIRGHWIYKSWEPEQALWLCDDGQIHGRTAE